VWQSAIRVWRFLYKKRKNMKYNIRLLVQCETEANSFYDALIKASNTITNVDVRDAKNLAWHYVDKDNKRYVLSDEGLIEVETFGKFKSLSVIEPNVGCLAPPASRGASQPTETESAESYNNRNRIS
jgi:hypothetical protein